MEKNLSSNFTPDSYRDSRKKDDKTIRLIRVIRLPRSVAYRG